MFLSHEAYLETLEFPPSPGEINRERYADEIEDMRYEGEKEEAGRIHDEATRLGVTCDEVIAAEEESLTLYNASRWFKKNRSHQDHVEHLMATFGLTEPNTDSGKCPF